MRTVRARAGEQENKTDDTRGGSLIRALPFAARAGWSRQHHDVFENGAAPAPSFYALDRRHGGRRAIQVETEKLVSDALVNVMATTTSTAAAPDYFFSTIFFSSFSFYLL